MEQPLDYVKRKEDPPRWFAAGLSLCGALVAGLVGYIWIMSI